MLLKIHFPLINKMGIKENDQVMLINQPSYYRDLLNNPKILFHER